MKLSIKLNPLLAYLLKRKEIDCIDEFTPVLCWWLVNFLMIVSLFSGNFFLGMLSPPCALAYLVIICTPVAIAFETTLSVSNAVQSPNRQLLLLTNISNTTFLQSHIFANIYRLRSLLRITINFMPVILVILSFVWMIPQTGFEGLCLKTPIGNTLCFNALDTSSLSTDRNLQSAFQASVAGFELTIGMAGITILMATAGAILGVYQRNRYLVALITGFLALVISLLLNVVVGPEIMLRAVVVGLPNPPIFLATLLLAALVPYPLAFALVRATSHLIWRPA
jgi:hypothetical protein